MPKWKILKEQIIGIVRLDRNLFKLMSHDEEFIFFKRRLPVERCVDIEALLKLISNFRVELYVYQY